MQYKVVNNFCLTVKMSKPSNCKALLILDLLYIKNFFQIFKIFLISDNVRNFLDKSILKIFSKSLITSFLKFCK